MLIKHDGGINFQSFGALSVKEQAVGKVGQDQWQEIDCLSPDRSPLNPSLGTALKEKDVTNIITLMREWMVDCLPGLYGSLYLGN